MIDTIGSGIKRMVLLQRQRSFPMPDYELSDSNKVVVRLTGRVVNENYTQLLMRQTEIDLMDVIALDKVQKKRPLDDETFNRLKQRKFIEVAARICSYRRESRTLPETGRPILRTGPSIRLTIKK